MTRVRHPHAFVWLMLAAALFMRAFLPQGYPQCSERAEPPCAFAGDNKPPLSGELSVHLYQDLDGIQASHDWRFTLGASQAV